MFDYFALFSPKHFIAI